MPKGARVVGSNPPTDCGLPIDGTPEPSMSNQVLSLEKRKIEQFETQCIKVKRHVKNLRKMKTIISL